MILIFKKKNVFFPFIDNLKTELNIASLKFLKLFSNVNFTMSTLNFGQNWQPFHRTMVALFNIAVIKISVWRISKQRIRKDVPFSKILSKFVI